MSKVFAGIGMFLVNFIFSYVLGYALVSSIPCNAAERELGCGLQVLIAPILLAVIYSLALWVLQGLLSHLRKSSDFLKLIEGFFLCMALLFVVNLSFHWLNYGNWYSLLMLSFVMFSWSIIVVTAKYSYR